MLHLSPYLEQRTRWPREGRHVLAQYDADSVVVYQAYRPAIGRFAVEHQHFGGDFSFSRMSWVKPNFLWMMYRCGWATKEGQEVVLAVRLRRACFDEILAGAVHSAFVPDVHGDEGVWRDTLRRYAGEWVVSIEDVTELVRAQHAHVLAHRLEQLMTPTEAVYPAPAPDVARRLQLSACQGTPAT